MFEKIIFIYCEIFELDNYFLDKIKKRVNFRRAAAHLKHEIYEIEMLKRNK